MKDTPIFGVNSDPCASVGFYSCADADSFFGIFRGIEDAPRTMLGRAELVLDGKPLDELVLNDILIAHPNPAAMTRYRIDADGVRREVRSSGLLVSTAAGSTAWIYQEGGSVMPLSSKKLQYVSRGVRGETPHLADRLSLHSMTRQAGIYIDGAHDIHPFPIGSDLVIRQGTPLTVIGNLEKKREAYKAG